MEMRELPVEGWHKVVHVRDLRAGLDAIISVHDATLGPGCGGCRVRPYRSFDEALEDVKKLSRAMSFKNALAGIPFGGGKSVIIADPRKDKTPEMFRAFGEALNALGGLYYTAEDSGVTEHDLEVVRSVSKFVGGIGAKGEGGNPAPYTARGVWRGIEAAVRYKLGRDSLKGVKVSILGVGAVGMALARLLHEAGARLVVADINEDAVAQAVTCFGAAPVAPARAIAADVDVFSPCALGGSVNRHSIAHLTAPIVAGAANNQLLTPDMDEALRAKGVLYAPDYVINAAGVISVGLEILGRWSQEEMNRRIDAIGPRLTSIFERADAEGRPTGAVADDMAMEIIADAQKAA
ncbi:Leu/Phe/Val dehydrogenase [Amphiplicatus metriothermophilus]|uniref:Leucine dehydrogenase n=1 Tax=Amphiplicatus metriothermophilus TaxID=1519374 RepID=A0A239PYN0_9PROT|nr:Glu/Leu/Phe/Val dehydrogenase dimerization domain-containing protein [Amphiplicatus metriothermophilus]MBB5519821.1 leucine dehydrogenase [Amphiplicatus metriothermophilus]SNT75133.1 leucine dehydrogenase [Amphiplicatus metriothermophilus]